MYGGSNPPLHTMEKSNRITMPGTRFYRIGQFTGPAPANKKEFEVYIKSGKAHEVTEEFEPLWGDAVYALTNDEEIYMHKRNWDTSD